MKSLLSSYVRSVNKQIQYVKLFCNQKVFKYGKMSSPTNPNLEATPAKKIKLISDVESSVVAKRTVATMCGAWRPEEEDGGLILVFKTREPCLSPDPTKECDFPENIEDFWEATFSSDQEIQMPFKIVQTTERGSTKLFIVPSGWESRRQVQYPKNPNESALVRNENSKPRADWPMLPCKVKRTGFVTYADAEEELSIMMQHSDTDTGPAIYEAQRETQLAMSGLPDFNNMADQLIIHSQLNSSAVTQLQQEPIAENTIWLIEDPNERAANPEPVIPPQPDTDTHKLTTIIENQNKIMDMQNKFSHRLSNFIIEIETTIEKAITRTISRQLDQSVVTLAEARNTAENSSFKIKPIDSINDLENLELLLLDTVERNKLMKMYSVVCSTAEGHGITCAYKLIDLLFTREFLCKCSWSGGSRGSNIKLPLKKYKNIINFCFKLIYSWDKSYTLEDNENFFKLVLRNAVQRKNSKNLRKPSKRNRSSKKQQAKREEINAIVDMAEEVEEETVNENGLEEETAEESTNETDMEEEIIKEIPMEGVEDDNVMEKDSTEVSENVNENVVKEVKVTNEVEKGEVITKDTQTQAEKEATKDIDVKEDMEKEMKMRSKVKEMYTKNVEKEILKKKLNKRRREKTIEMKKRTIEMKRKRGVKP